MKRKVLSITLLTLFLAMSILTSTLNAQTINVESATIIVPDDYPTIKEAINVANAGDTIIVSAGRYTEGQITVNKPVSLVADGFVIVDGPEILLQSAFHVASDNVTIRDFIIRRSHIGIKLEDVNWCVIEGNSLIDNYDGIRTHNFGDHNIIRENRITAYEQYAIVLRGPASFNLIEENEIIGTRTGQGFFFGGIDLDWSFTKNTICDNTVSLKTIGAGIHLNYHSSQNDVSNNKVSGGSIGISIWDSDYNTVERNAVEDSRWGIGIGDSRGNLIRQNRIENATNRDSLRAGGIILYYGGNHHNVVEKNFISKCYDGIRIEESSHTTICDNTIKKGAGYGLAVTANSNYTVTQKNVVLLNQEFDLYWDQTGTGNTWAKNRYRTRNW